VTEPSPFTPLILYAASVAKGGLGLSLHVQQSFWIGARAAAILCLCAHRDLIGGQAALPLVAPSRQGHVFSDLDVLRS
jgi:hypothetical protein